MSNSKAFHFLLILYAAVSKGHLTMTSGWRLMSNTNLTFDPSDEFKSWTDNSSGVTWMLARNNVTHQTELWSYSIISGEWTKRRRVPDPPDPSRATMALCGQPNVHLVLLRSSGETKYFLFNSSKWDVERQEDRQHLVNVVAWWCTEAYLWVLTRGNILRMLDMAKKDWRNVTLTPADVPSTALIKSYRWSKSNLLYALSRNILWTLDTSSGAWTELVTNLPSTLNVSPSHSATCLDSNDNFWLFDPSANMKTGLVFHSKTSEWSTVDVPVVPVDGPRGNKTSLWCVQDQVFIVDTNFSNWCHYSKSNECSHGVKVWSIGLRDMQSSSVARTYLNNSESLTLKADCDKDTNSNIRPNFHSTLEESSTEGSKPQDDDLQLNNTSNSTIFLSFPDTWNVTVEPSSNVSNGAESMSVGRGSPMMGRGRISGTGHRSGIGIALSRPETYGSVIFFGLSLSVFATFGIMLFFRRCVSCPPRNSVLLKEAPPVRYTEITEESFAA